VEAAVGLSTVVPVRSAVEMKWQRTRELDRGQGFGAALDRCQAVLGAAQALEEAAAYDLALQKYGQLREECERLLQLDGLRREALRDRETAATARNRAVAADAGAAAPGIMAGADELAESAAAAFAAGRFDEAATPWVTAVAEYAKAEAAAKGRRAVQIAKTAYEAELQQADAALLDTFGGPLWAELREAVEEAETLTAEGNWDAALQKFEQAHAALPAVLAAALRAKTHPVAITSADAAASARVAAAVARAEAARVEADWDTVIRCATEALGHDPGAARAQALLNEARKARACRITVSAAVGETEIRGARISVDGVLQDERTPATIELQRGREYTIRVLPEAAPGQRRFAPFETVYRVDVGGDRELRARLEEMRFYPDLIAVADAAAAPLNGLAAGSEEALARQRETAHGLGVPVEVRTQKAGIALCLVPPGRFTMGPTASNAGAKATMPGSRVVTLTKPVYVGKIEVTRAQWDMVMGIVQKGRTPVRPALPAVQVNWIECERFCRALCRLEGVPEGTYRLLTEAEWEYACRAGTDTAYYTGETVADLSRAGWHAANSDSRLHPGAQRQANAWGLYDLPGNAREWCLDWYGAYPAQVVTDPPGPADGTHRVVRGGSWSDAPDACAASYRQHYPPEFREEYLGFRVARETW